MKNTIIICAAILIVALLTLNLLSDLYWKNVYKDLKTDYEKLETNYRQTINERDSLLLLLNYPASTRKLVLENGKLIYK